MEGVKRIIYRSDQGQYNTTWRIIRTCAKYISECYFDWTMIVSLQIVPN